jgi:DNA-binding XRE family transcriptional regulator
MTRREAKHIHRALTPEERARVAEVRRQVTAEEHEIRQKAQRYNREYQDAQAALHDALKLLKSERERLGLSLTEVAERTGIERPNLSRLENENEPNPTVATLTRYADALGKRVLIVLADRLPAG